MRNILTAIFLAFCLTAFGQTGQELCGFVKEAGTGTPVPGATVRFVDADGRLLTYAISNGEGYFAARRVEGICRIIVQSMGYRQQTLEIGGLTFPCKILMTEQATVLRDVYVQAPDIERRSDTLSYFVGRYARAEDRTIADVLRRLPGIKVEEDGQIKYNDEPINKFYIDGADFLGGRYGLAVNNIRPEDVATVDVMENHQPIKVLKGIEFSEQAGLNLKLREGAGHRWVGVATGAAGAEPFLADGSLFAMRIAGKYQAMETLRAGNTGWNPATQSAEQTQTTLFSADIAEDRWPNLFSDGALSCELAEERIRDSRSALANTSNSWQRKGGGSVGVNLTYERDDLMQQSGYVTDYFSDEIEPFAEQNRTDILKNNLNGVLTIKDNTASHYLSNKLSADALWLDSDAQIGGTRTVSQTTRMPSATVGNDLQIIQRLGSNILSLSSRNRFRHKAHSLGAAAEDDLRQTLTTDNFRSVTEGKYGRIVGKWHYFLCGNLDLDYYRQDARLKGLAMDLPEISGRQNRTVIDFSLSPEASYQSSRWLLTLRLPVMLHHARSGATEACRLLASPSVYARGQLTAKLDIAAQSRFQMLPVSGQDCIAGTILTDYRTLRSTTPTNAAQKRGTLAMTLRYRNPISSVFANLTLRQEWQRLPILQNQVFGGNYILLANTAEPCDARATNLSGGISKGLGHGNFLIGLDAAFSQVNSTAMRNDQPTPYVTRQPCLQAYAKGHITRHFGLDYKANFARNLYSAAHQDRSATNIIKQNLTLTLSLSNWLFQLGAEHYYTTFNSQTSSNTILFDTSLRWAISKRLTLSLIAKNLLNQRAYRFSRHAPLSQTEHTYHLRARNIIAHAQLTF